MSAPATPNIPGYRLEGLLGRGGMGLVYKALEEELGRHVALKVIVPELASEERFRSRFLRESRLAASLDHPNVIPIYGAGEAEGSLYISMRYVEGDDLRTRLTREQAIEPQRALAIVAQLAGALDAAHQRGLVHRDVKPSNVLLDEDGHVYLSDFGLSKRLASAEATQTGQFVGTLDYLAPEQIRGKALDGRTDQYALACLFYECLSGTAPFHRETEAETLWAHMQEPPPPLAGHPELAHVLARGLAKDIAKRYETCADFAAAAGQALAPDAVGPRAVRRPHLRRALRRPSRRQAAVAVGSTVAAIAAALSLFFTLGSGGVRVTSDSLLIVDAVHGQVAADLPLGPIPADVTTGSGLVWVLSGDGRSVTAIDPATLRVIQTIDLHGNSTRQWAGGATRFGATDFVALSGTSTLDLVTKNSPGVSGVNPTAVTRITPWQPSPGDAACAAFVTGSGTKVWFSKGRHLAEIDARTGVVIGTRLLAAGPQARAPTCYGVRYTGANLLAARSPDSSVGYLDPATGAFRLIVVGFPGLGARSEMKDAVDWASGFGSLWLDAKGTLVQVALSTGRIVARIPVGTGGGKLVVDPSSGVWVLEASGRSLFRVNPATRRVSSRIGLDRRACCIAAGFRRIWVTLDSSRPS